MSMKTALALKRGLSCVALALCVVLALPGCRREPQNQQAGGQTPATNQALATLEPAAAPSGAGIVFSDATSAAGIHFSHNNGATGLKLMPETNGAGVAFIDYDGDGWQDIFFVNGRDWTDAEVEAYGQGTGRGRPYLFAKKRPRRHTTGALYHNNRDGTFTDVTKGSGLDIEMYGQGVAVGDYDNDGKPDIYVTAYPHNYLFRNVSTSSAPRFQDVTETAGVRDGGWSTSAMWLDYDRDGLLDLFVCHYVRWSPATDKSNFTKSGAKVYGSPEVYGGQLDSLYRNLGHGRFADVSVKAGIRGSGAQRKAMEQSSKGLGVALCDYDNDLWPDIVVTNDREPNFLFHNNTNGTFSEVAGRAGIARNAAGWARAGMGIDAADIDQSNRESIAISNFSGEMLGLYQNMGNGLFQDIAGYSDVAQVSAPFLSFGCVYVDVDNDGWLDVAVANGHVNDLIEEFRHDRAYQQRMLLFHNMGAWQRNNRHSAQVNPLNSVSASAPPPVAFQEIGTQLGEALQKPIVGRGLACADFDLDGDPDLLVTVKGGPARLLRNDGGNRNNALRVTLQGTKSNRSAIGAVVWAEVGADSIRRRVHSGSSYLSQSELPLTFGLGQHTQVQALTVRWPSGKLARFKQIAANQMVTINEDKGIVGRQLLKRP